MNKIARRWELAHTGNYSEASALDKEIKKSAKRDRSSWFSDKLSHNIWDPVRLLGKDRAPKVVRLKGKAIDTSAAQVYAEHLENHQWSNSRTPAEGAGFTSSPTSSFISSPQGAQGAGLDPAEPLEGVVTPDEVTEMIRRVKVGKQGGPDGMRPEFLKWAGTAAVAAIADFFTRSISDKKFPSQWSEAEVVGIYKKGDCFDPSNYRPISLLNALYKLFSALIAWRLM
eukprot:14362598-Alexandrium_andersonii.AAC.1